MCGSDDVHTTTVQPFTSGDKMTRPAPLHGGGSKGGGVNTFSTEFLQLVHAQDNGGRGGEGWGGVGSGEGWGVGRGGEWGGVGRGGEGWGVGRSGEGWGGVGSGGVLLAIHRILQSYLCVSVCMI